jgi:hypothetical protein
MVDSNAVAEKHVPMEEVSDPSKDTPFVLTETSESAQNLNTDGLHTIKTSHSSKKARSKKTISTMFSSTGAGTCITYNGTLQW